VQEPVLGSVQDEPRIGLADVLDHEQGPQRGPRLAQARGQLWLSSSAASARFRAVMSRVTPRTPVGRPVSSRTHVKVDSTHTVEPSLHGCSSSSRR
jgi:hypothetical protein